MFTTSLKGNQPLSSHRYLCSPAFLKTKPAWERTHPTSKPHAGFDTCHRQGSFPQVCPFLFFLIWLSYTQGWELPFFSCLEHPVLFQPTSSHPGKQHVVPGRPHGHPVEKLYKSYYLYCTKKRSIRTWDSQCGWFHPYLWSVYLIINVKRKMTEAREGMWGHSGAGGRLEASFLLHIEFCMSGLALAGSSWKSKFVSPLLYSTCHSQ